MLLTFIFTVLVLFVGWAIYKKNVKSKLKKCPSFPPGPKGWPMVGNLLNFRNSPLTTMLRWKEQYGDIVGLQLGEYRAVLISDYALIKEAFNNEAFNGRPDFIPALLFTNGENKGTLTSDGEPWDLIRRFTVKQLNELGFGKKSMENFILDNIQELLAQFSDKVEAKELIDLHDRFYLPVTGNLWYILTGEIISGKKSKLLEDALVKLNNALWQPIGSAIWFYPSLTKWFPNWTGWTHLTQTLPVFKRLVFEKIEEHEECLRQDQNQNTYELPVQSHYSERQHPIDLIDAYLHRIKSTSDPTSEFSDTRGKSHMESMLLNLLVTGAESMSNTLSWTCMYLSLYPEVQDRLFQEIVDVIGQDRVPSLNDPCSVT